MNKSRKITDLDYINFLVAAQCDASCVKAAECYSVNDLGVALDKINRFLTRQSLTPETLWNEVEPYVEKRSGWLIVDDTVIDKIHSKQIDLTYYQWSGKHHSVVKGIGLITLSGPMDPIPTRSIIGFMTKTGMSCQRTIISGTWSGLHQGGGSNHPSSCLTVGIPGLTT